MQSHPVSRYVTNKRDKPDLRDCLEKAAKYCFDSETGRWKPGDREINIETGSLPAKPGELTGIRFYEKIL